MRVFSQSRTATLFCCALFLCASFAAPPANAAPPKEIEVGMEVVLAEPGDAGGTRRGKPAIAFGKDSYLAVWQEGWHGDGGSSRIHALRLGLDGKAIDARSIEIAPAVAGVQENPRVAFFGGNYLVVWQDLRNGKDNDVLAVRVSAAGKVLDSEPLVIAGGPRTQTMPDVAADDQGFMVVWHGFQGDDFQAKVYARRVGADGNLAATRRLMVGASPRIAWNGKQHLVVYYQADSPGGGTAMASVARWQRMDTTGKLLPSQQPGRLPGWIPSKTPLQCSTAALPDGKGWIIVTHGGAPDYWGRTFSFQRAIRVTAEGAIDAPADRTAQGLNPAAYLTIGSKFKHAADIWPYGRSAAAADGQSGVVVWQRFHIDDATGLALVNGDIRTSRVDRWQPLDGVGGVPVAESPADELDPELAGNGAGKFLCIYEKHVEGRSSIAVRTLRTR